MVEAIPLRAGVQIATPGAVTAAIAAADKEKAEANNQPSDTQMVELAGFIREQFSMMKQHRNQPNAGWSERLLKAMRAFNGEYDATKLQEIKKFGGSDVYARLISMKCRGASSLLRDVYLGPDRPWGLSPSEDPPIPPQILESIKTLVMSELQGMAQPQLPGPDGMMPPPPPPPDAGQIRDRIMMLMQAARQAGKKKAKEQAEISEEKLDEILVEGGFYKALAEFLVDIPLFPFAAIKGPTVRIVSSVDWSTGKAQVIQKPKLFWNRVSPFDLWWTPGVSDIEDGAMIERTRVTRADLNDLLDLPGYNVEAIRSVLDEYGRGGLNEDWDASDTERAQQESRENPQFNRSGLISCLEYHGNVQGRMLLQYGMDESLIPDELRDYMVQVWMIGRYIIKVQLSPSPRKRHPYYVTSFEKVPGTPVGNGLPDILADIQDVANATLRALVNNLSISSGPQVVVNDDRLAPDEDGEELYPWKRWHVQNDPMGGQGSNSGEKPVDFFQPQSNAQELLGVYKAFSDLADDLSAIPRYMSGDNAGGAGRTASGLAMLMGNASKILQTVAANIDRDILDPALTGLFDIVMLTDTSGMLTGEETVRVMGVQVALQRETQRSRQIEFLQATANPIDAQIMGPKGRGAVLRAVSQTIGLDGEQIVPDEPAPGPTGQPPQPGQPGQPPQPGQPDMAQAGAQAQGGQAPPAANKDMGPRTNSIQGGVG